MNLYRSTFSLLGYCFGLLIAVTGACKTIDQGSTSKGNHPERRLGWNWVRKHLRLTVLAFLKRSKNG